MMRTCERDQVARGRGYYDGRTCSICGHGLMVILLTAAGLLGPCVVPLSAAAAGGTVCLPNRRSWRRVREGRENPPMMAGIRPALRNRAFLARRHVCLLPFYRLEDAGNIGY